MSWRVPTALLALSGVTAGWWLHGASPGLPLDDAWVHLVYARSVAAGEGFAFNPGVPEAGVTAPLWTGLLALAEWVAPLAGPGYRADQGARVLGGLFGMLLAWAGYRLNGRAGRWPAVFAGAFLLLDPLQAYGRFSGMELPLFGLLSLLLVGALLDHAPRRAGWWAGLLVLARPEGLVLVAAAALLLRRHRVRLLPFAIPVVVCVAPWLAWCASVTGRPFPNTVALKAAMVIDPTVIGPTLLALLRDTGWGWALPMLLLAGAISLDGGTRLLGTMQAGMALALLLAVVLTRPMHLSEGLDGRTSVLFYSQRYALLAWPLLLSVASAGLASLVRTGWAGFFCRPLAAVMLLGPLAVVLVCGRFLPGHAEVLRQRASEQCAQVEAQNVAAGRWLAAHTAPGALVATHDAGAITYFSRRRVLDVWGNNCTPLASAIWRGGRDPVEASRAATEVLAARRPDALVVFPLQYAAGQAVPELRRLSDELRDDPSRLSGLLAYVQGTGEDLAAFWGLTRRAATFHVDRPVTVDSPVHSDLAIFVRP